VIGGLQAGRSAGGYGLPCPHHHERRTDADEVGKDAITSWTSALVITVALRGRSLLDASASTGVSTPISQWALHAIRGAVSDVGSASGVITQPPISHVIGGLFLTGRKRRYAFRASDSRWH
jgi:hypothetical protein